MYPNISVLENQCCDSTYSVNIYIYIYISWAYCLLENYSTFNIGAFQLSSYSPLNRVYKVSKTEIKWWKAPSKPASSLHQGHAENVMAIVFQPLTHFWKTENISSTPILCKISMLLLFKWRKRMCNIFSDKSQYSSLRNLSSYKVTTAAVQYPSIFYPLLTHREWIREERWKTAILSPKHHKNKRLSNIPCKSVLNTARFLTFLLFLDCINV